MILKQVSVFLENKSGRLNEVTRILGDAGINISACTIADTSDFGILRLIVSDPEQARDVLRENFFSVQITEVVLVKSPNKPGGLAAMLKMLSDEEIFIEYLYGFSMQEDAATIVIRPTNVEKCLRILQKYREDFLFTDKGYQL